MNILGISGGVLQGNQDASAALLVDGQLVFAQEEERLTRQKHAVGSLPEKAVKAALKHAGIDMADVDVIAFHAEYYNLEDPLRRFFMHHFGSCPEIRFKNHHMSHAASTYYASGWSDAMVLTTDLSGDGISTMLAHGHGRELKQSRVYRKPQSLGIFYSLITQVLGFRRDSDEYKVMGMASYGNPTVDLEWLLSVGNGGYQLDETFIQRVNANTPNPSKQEPFYADALVDRVGWRRLPGEPYTQKHFDFAHSAQCRLNDAAVEMVGALHRETGSRRLCVAGGVGLNCVMNQKLLEMNEVDELFVQPASSDAGTALGAAYLVAAEEGEAIAPFRTAHLGNEFDNDEIRDQLEILGVSFEPVENPAEAAADRIATGKIISWFQGRHEYGPRALGARSILADPRVDEMKDLINMRVKFREEFRPFAPSCLESAASDYFVTHGQPHPYMTVTNNVHEAVKEKIPAVVHVDGTSRVQTVDRERTGIYADLMAEVGRRTGIPMVVNTSFNVKGDPVVNTPTQAVATLFGSGMDSLVIGNFVVDKRR